MTDRKYTYRSIALTFVALGLFALWGFLAT
jgi:hypothetical protein